MSVDFSFFGIILLGLLVVGVVWLLVKGSNTAKWIAGVVLLLLVLLSLTHFVSDQKSETEAVSVRTELRQLDTFTSGQSIWQVTVENEFEADLYPSLETAAEALGRKIAPKLSSSLSEEPGVSDAFITTYGSGQIAELESQAAEEIRRELLTSIKIPSFHLERIPKDSKRIKSSDTTKECVMTVRIPTWRRGSAPWTRTARQQTDGTLQVRVQYENEEFGESVQFIEKPWVSNFSLFSSQEPQEHYFIAQSRNPCTSPSKARHEALADAAAQLAQRIVENAGWYRQQFNVDKRSPWTIQGIKTLVRTELEGNVYHVKQSNVNHRRRGKYISDRFVQRFHRPYGDIWREALLINGSKESVDTLAGMYAQTLRAEAGMYAAERESWLRIVLSAMGMLGIVCVVYVFLNSATKGYYSASLRVAAVVLALAIIGIAMVLA